MRKFLCASRFLSVHRSSLFLIEITSLLLADELACVLRSIVHVCESIAFF